MTENPKHINLIDIDPRDQLAIIPPEKREELRLSLENMARIRQEAFERARNSPLA